MNLARELGERRQSAAAAADVTAVNRSTRKNLNDLKTASWKPSRPLYDLPVEAGCQLDAAE